MENSNHLLIGSDLFLCLFVGFTHLVAALNTLNHIDIILLPQRKRVLSLAFWAGGTCNKSFTHN